LLDSGEQAKALYSAQSQKASQDFLLKGIDLANTADLNYKISQNQRLLVELCLMQLASITFDGEKKKPNAFIIAATHFRNNSYSITEVKSVSIIQSSVVIEQVTESSQEISVENLNSSVSNVQIVEKSLPIKEKTEQITEKILEIEQTVEPSKIKEPSVIIPEILAQQSVIKKPVSALSLAGLRAKKELEAKQSQHLKHLGELPSEKFTETDMLLQWNKFAQRMSDTGKMLLSTYMLMNEPILNGTTITLELPNESTKEEFLSGCVELIGYLRGKLHNHDIVINVKVNETVEKKYAFTPDDKYERLRNINPALDLLRKTFDLDV
jgi:DNA polymerase-3 subunit gamma/tau